MRISAHLPFQLTQAYSQITSVVGGSVESSNVRLSGLQYGQTKDVVIRLRVQESALCCGLLLEGTLGYATTGKKGERKVQFAVQIEAGDELSGLSQVRFHLVESIRYATSSVYLRRAHEPKPYCTINQVCIMNLRIH